MLNRLDGSGLKIPEYVRQAGERTPFAVLTRYPALVGPVVKPQYRRAIRFTAGVLKTKATRGSARKLENLQGVACIRVAHRR